MTTTLLIRRFLSDYARNPVNLLTLVLVPVVFVVVAAGPLADAAELLGGASGDLAVEMATAGWAAGFLAGVAMYFQIAAARDADRRLVISGLRPGRLVSARLLTGLGLALVAAAAALIALQLRTGIAFPAKAAAGTVMFAIIYLAIGAVVGALVRNPVNGTVVILFVWIVDVFFGPTLSTADRVATRVLPTHFVSLWMMDLPSRHGGRLGDLGLALSWTLGAIVVAWAAIAGTSRVARNRRRPSPGSVVAQLRVAVRMALREWRRNPALWALFVAVPAVFILISDAITPHGSTAVAVVEKGRRAVELFDPAHIHAGTMAPIAIASLATLTGLFVALDSRSGDRRLRLAGMRAPVLLVSRLSIVVVAALLATGVSLAVTATVFGAHQWVLYAAASALIGLTYGLLGVLIGPIFGRVSGVFIAFLVPFLDLGIAQSPMLRRDPAGWAHYLPGFGGGRLFIDGALTSSFDETRALVIAIAWLAALALAAVALFRRTATNQAR
ncbi:MAG TPA: ABC transporter permease [Actinomycetes bacterium]|nr:ABC transporter permease [Actinomycetes bacterium]